MLADLPQTRRGEGTLNSCEFAREFRASTCLKNLAHDISSGAAQLLTEPVEVLQIGLYKPPPVTNVSKSGLNYTFQHTVELNTIGKCVYGDAVVVPYRERF